MHRHTYIHTHTHTKFNSIMLKHTTSFKVYPLLTFKPFPTAGAKDYWSKNSHGVLLTHTTQTLLNPMGYQNATNHLQIIPEDFSNEHTSVTAEFSTHVATAGELSSSVTIPQQARDTRDYHHVDLKVRRFVCACRWAGELVHMKVGCEWVFCVIRFCVCLFMSLLVCMFVCVCMFACAGMFVCACMFVCDYF